MYNTKRTLVILLALLFSFHSFAQTPATTTSDSPSISIGAYGVAEIALGSYAQFARVAAGGGVSGEYALQAVPGLGFSGRIQAATIVPNADEISSYWALGTLGGAFWRFSLSRNFALQPELAAGMWLHNIKATGKDGSTLSNMFIDPAVQASLALRWKVSHFDLELAPVYTMLIEKSAILSLAGLRLGAVYAIK